MVCERWYETKMVCERWCATKMVCERWESEDAEAKEAGGTDLKTRGGEIYSSRSKSAEVPTQSKLLVVLLDVKTQL